MQQLDQPNPVIAGIADWLRQYAPQLEQPNRVAPSVVANTLRTLAREATANGWEPEKKVVR